MHYKIFNILLLCFIIINCSKKQEETLSIPQEFDNEISVDDDYYFEKNIYQVVDNVYVAIGYGLANSILIVGDGGNIIIDVTESDILAAEITVKEISSEPLISSLRVNFESGGRRYSDLFFRSFFAALDQSLFLDTATEE